METNVIIQQPISQTTSKQKRQRLVDFSAR